MAAIAQVSIDLAKIDKSQVVTKKNKNGTTAKYLNVDVLIRDDVNNYNQNVSIYHSQSKEQRLAKEDKNYVGNGRVVWVEGAVEAVPYNKPAVAKTEAVTEDLDF
jgi:hypothetical protein